MPDLSVSLFGPPQIKRGNEQISIQRRKDLALLIYLVVTSQPHSRDTLATLLWQDQSQADARSNLRKSLSRLKISLGKKSILVSRERVSLNPNLSINLDIVQFDSRVHQVRKHKHTGNESGLPLCKECQNALEEAAHLYRADFLEGFGLLTVRFLRSGNFFNPRICAKIWRRYSNISPTNIYKRKITTQPSNIAVDGWHWMGCMSPRTDN